MKAQSVIALAGAAAALPSLATSAESVGTARPNIVFILCDDMGYGDIGCNGNPYIKTPHIDALAKQGVRFTQGYMACPVSSPSRAALMTGKYPARLQLTNFIAGNRTDDTSPVDPAPWTPYLPTEEITMAEYLRAEGYRTGHVGKWHLAGGGLPGQQPWEQGFDYSRMIAKNGLDYYNYTIALGSHDQVFADDGTHYLTDKLTDYAVEFIDQSPDRPFFLYLAYSAPHVLVVPRGDKVRDYLFSYTRPEFDSRYNPYYAAMVESIDDGVARVVKALEKAGRLDNTLIVFTSDNGGLAIDELGPPPTHLAPMRGWKGHLHEGGIRVPMIISWPEQLSRGATTDSYITCTDFLPTFMEIIGAPAPKSAVDGKSFLPLLRHPEQAYARGPLFWHYPHFSNQESRPAAAIRDGEYKLIESLEDGTLELYNLRIDPLEQHNLANTLPAKAELLRAQLHRWQQSVGANMPVKKEVRF